MLISARDAAIDQLHARTAIYTADTAVRELLSHVDWPGDGRKLVDPSCGDGAFLIQALHRLLTVAPHIDEAELIQVLEGWEVHPAAAEAARHRVEACLRISWSGGNDPRRVARLIVRNADFLTSGPLEGTVYHVIAGNPPYLRAANVPDILRREYEQVTPAFARSDLLHAFLHRCSSLLTPDGEIAFITSDRWLFNMGTAALRAAMGERLGISHLERLDASSCFHRPKVRRAGSPPRVHPVAVVMRNHAEGAIELGRSAIYPEAAANNSQQSSKRTLADVASIRLAPWLGATGAFVVDTTVAQTLPDECLVPAVDTDDIVDGVLQAPTRYAIRTSPDAPPPPKVLDHIRANIHCVPESKRRKRAWLPPESWAKVDLSKPSLLVPRITKSLRPVRLPAGVLPINHNLTIVSEAEMPLSEIEAALCSPAAQEWLQVYAPRLENGYRSLTTSLLRNFPIN